MREFRLIVVASTVGSFALASALGILTLLGSGFGETQSQILLTTAVVGISCLLTLCLLPLTGHRFVWVGAVGGLATLIAAGSALLLVWGPQLWDSPHWEPLLKSFTSSSVLAWTAAQVALLVALIGRPGVNSRLNALLAATCTLAALVAALAVVPILFTIATGDGYWRTFSVLCILDALGTISLVAFGAFPRMNQSDAQPTHAPLTPAKFHFSK